jgi:hypothetical protein
VLRNAIYQLSDPRYIHHEKLALAKIAVFAASNLQFGPEVGVGPLKADAAVVSTWLEGIRSMARDLESACAMKDIESHVVRADARQSSMIERKSIDAIITSPPYPNEKDYTRTTRLELVLLDFVCSKEDLRKLKQQLIRSNTRSVYRTDNDDQLIAGHPEILRIADEIEARREALGKTSGFERMYARVTKLYFGGMKRHLAALRPFLKSGAQLAYVVGDQASYLQVMIRTGHLLGEIAESLGYTWEDTRIFRTRLATATRMQLNEEVVLLRWPGALPR